MRALMLADTLGLSAAYDMHYLALAEAIGCELWTADAKFHRQAQPHFANVHLLDEAAR
jgi:predicted nucleic acid-binding protein